MTASPPFAPPGTERPPLRASVLALLLTAVAAGLIVAGSVAAAPASVRVALGWGAGAGAVLLSAAVATATHALRSARLRGRHLAAAAGEAGQLHREREQLAAAVDQLRAQLTAEEARHSARLTAEGARLAAEHAAERDRLAAAARLAVADRTSAITACANASARMQAMATGILADLRQMEERHADENVLADLLHLDHRTAQAGRLADSVAVLTGARSGRRWARPISMESVLRGAMGRIGGYQRVRVHSTGEVSVAGHAAEGVMHVLAELLDNAAKFSPPTAEVHVYVEQVPAGVIVSVEDSGLVMGEVQLRRAKRAVSGEATDLGGLSGTRLGLAVVGRLARKHGLTVSFRPSARGGTGVLVLVPQELLGRSAAPQAAAPAQAVHPRPAPAAAPAPAPAATADEASSTATLTLRRPTLPSEQRPGSEANDNGDSNGGDGSDGDGSDGDSGDGALPHRRRGRTLAAAEGARRTGAPAQPARTDVRAGLARFGSFRQAVRGGAAQAGAAAGTEGPAGQAGQADQADQADRTGHPADPLSGRAPATPPHSESEGDTPR
ncbi:ATP-binding protein [Kitasatospora sp. NBC_01287]|uniref:sensor histidine kinase n=1 Tax=Kitasatospora sp. NBC_01287 TaxID=2903573 RepID=UPI0022533591|nr:ATP-binding protein [Kitasatospora sp. NBC_01287]MCX4744939.1 ATP-binding protein [Kitasatospora sp. NBC_01287]